VSVLMVKEVTDCGNLANEGIRDGRVPLLPKKDTLSTFVNYGVHLKNFLRAPQYVSSEKRKSLTWRAGLFSGTGNLLSHLAVSTESKETVWKRYRRHEVTQNLVDDLLWDSGNYRNDDWLSVGGGGTFRFRGF